MHKPLREVGIDNGQSEIDGLRAVLRESRRELDAIRAQLAEIQAELRAADERNELLQNMIENAAKK